MPTRNASAVWKGKLKEGSGTMKLGSGAFEGNYSFESRFEDGTGTNPEELIAASSAGCFSMAFSLALEKAGFEPKNIQTKAKISLEKQEEGFAITKINLENESEIGGIDEESFKKISEDAKNNCPVSKALKGVEINLNAKLVKTA